MKNPFFKNKGPFKIDKLLNFARLKNNQNYKNFKVHDIKDLLSSTKIGIWSSGYVLYHSYAVSYVAVSLNSSSYRIVIKYTFLFFTKS